MNHARVWVNVRPDATGNSVRLPVIIILQNEKLVVLEPLLKYFLSHHHERSRSWMLKLCQIIERLLDYLYVTFNAENKPVDLFKRFVSALVNGTLGNDNYDPSGLCWFPTSSDTLYPKLHMLEDFSDWMVREAYVPESMNPWVTATSYEQRLNWIAWYRRNDYSFLGHLANPEERSVAVQQARNISLRRMPSDDINSVKAFPADFEVTLLREGFIRPGKQHEPDIIQKFDWRGICICLLMLYGGKRLSEPFHLWVGDVQENPTRPGDALVRIYHPTEGRAPDKPKINGRRASNRKAYLQAFYPNYLPRILGTGNYYSGFKGRQFSDRDGKFMQVHWLPSQMGQAFLWAYHNYMQQRAMLGLNGSSHPFAFVSHHGKQRGEPYTIAAFEATWERAVKRIGLPYMKMYGTTPHGGRHAIGLRANRAEVDLYDAQQIFAHRSPDSQKKYRAPGPSQVSTSLDAASARIDKRTGTKNREGLDIDWKEIWSPNDE